MLNRKPTLALFVITIIFSVFSFVKTFRDVQKFGDIDLRDKIVGARLLSAGLSPYLYKWKNGDDVRLLDPLDGFDKKISRVTVPPSLLMFFIPLSKLNHGVIQWIWFAFSYLCFLLILFQFHDLVSAERKLYVWIAGLFFFLCTMAWQFHVERGQVYIFYTCILSSVYWFYKKDNHFIAGILLALLCWIRLPFLVSLPLLFFLTGRKNIFIGFFSSAVFLVLLSFLFVSTDNWRDYFSSMLEWSKFELHEMSVVQNTVKSDIPPVIEGQINLGTMRDFQQNNRSIQCIALWLFDIKLYSKELLGIFLAVLLGISSIVFFRWKKNKFTLNDEISFLFFFLAYILSEYFTPAPSYSYHYVQWVFPVLLCVSTFKLQCRTAGISILLGLSMNLGAMSFIPYNFAIGEAIIFTGTFLFCIHGQEG